MKALKVSFVVIIAAVAVSAPGYGDTPTNVNASERPPSTFDSKEIGRNPFLPIGWQKKKVVQGGVSKTTVSPSAFRVTSIVTGGDGAELAIINGRDYAVGETVKLNVDGKEVGVRVKGVKDGRVIFWHDGHDITAPLISQ